MRKLWAFLLSGVFSLCVTSAEAKVCFLPNVLIGGKCVSLSKAKYSDCKGFSETTPCEDVGKETIETCINESGKTFYKCGCRGDVISWDVINENNGWLCESGYAQECGCSAEHIVCEMQYKYRGDGTGKCAKSDENENSVGVGACALPNGKVYYKDCNCNAYPYECDGLTGLRGPTGDGNSSVGCKSPHSSNYRYKECECASGWTSGSCENNTNGCLMPISYVTANDGNLTCALCDERLCRSSGESNLEAIYCAPRDEDGILTYGGEYLTSTVTSCVDLGFVQGATGGFCPAGTQKAGEEGVRCPFDGNYMFCEEQSGCFPTREACEESDIVKTCTEISGCYRISECQNGYELNNKLGVCVISECPAGYTTETLDCTDAEHGLMHGYIDSTHASGTTSGGKDCEQCECDIAAARAENYCWYITSGTNGILAGEGILSVPCCDGSYSECSFPFGTTEPSEGVATHEIHQACGDTYYIPTSCLDGYVLKDGNCELVACASGYSTSVQSVEDCTNGSELYKGASGWTISAQETNGHVIQSGGKTCYKCTCNTQDQGCTWDVSNKGSFGRLEEKSACCDGTYKSCVASLCTGMSTDDLTEDGDASNDCIPQSASSSICTNTPAHAISLKKYDACGQATRCLVKQCEQGYKPSTDGLSCVAFESCAEIGYTASPHANDPAWSCSMTALKDGNGNRCYDCTCSEGYSETSVGVCTKNCANGYAASIPPHSTYQEIDGCYKMTGCETGYRQVGLSCRAKTCEDYGLQGKCVEPEVANGTYTRQLGSSNGTCYTCYLPEVKECEYTSGYYACNLETQTDCVLDKENMCYVPKGKKCLSKENGLKIRQFAPCSGEGEYLDVYTENCGLLWTGQCLSKMPDVDYVNIRPVLPSYTIWNEKEGKYFTIDDLRIEISIHSLREVGRPIMIDPEKGGRIERMTIFKDGANIAVERDYIYDTSYFVAVRSVEAVVSEHEYKEFYRFDNTVKAYDVYAMMKDKEKEPMNLLRDGFTITTGDHILRRGTIDLTDAVIVTGGQCELYRLDNGAYHPECMTFVKDNKQVDYEHEIALSKTTCGHCIEAAGYDMNQYPKCFDDYNEPCVSDYDPRWIIVTGTSFDPKTGEAINNHHNISYILMHDIFKKGDEMYDQWVDTITQWQYVFK